MNAPDKPGPARLRAMVTTEHGLVVGALALWMLPTLVSLSQQTWRTEAGSLAPLLLVLGGWSLFECRRRCSHLASKPSVALPTGILCLLIPVYLFATAIDMVALMAVCAWLGGVIAFYVLGGWKLTWACAFPLAFLGLIVPLPYSLSLPANVFLRNLMASSASDLARGLSMETAVDRNYIFIDQYQLSIDTACAGLNSTMSLVAVGLLFAYWMRAYGWRGYLWAIIFSVPLALAANVLRIVALLWLVRFAGPEWLDTVIHPLSGILSFTFALALFALTYRILLLVPRYGKP